MILLGTVVLVEGVEPWLVGDVDQSDIHKNDA